MGSVISAIHVNMSSKHTDVNEVKAYNESGDAVSAATFQSQSIAVSDSVTNQADLSKFDCSCQRRYEPEVSEVTPINNEASLFGDSPTYTEGTWSPGHVVDKVLHDIMSMYNSGRQDEDLGQNWADNFLHLTQATSLLEQEQERVRRENGSKEQALLQTKLKQQQMLQRELRMHGLRDAEHDEMIREELDHQEVMEQEQRRRESPLSRTPDVDRVIPSTKAVSQLKAEETQAFVDESMPYQPVYSKSAHRLERDERGDRSGELGRGESLGRIWYSSHGSELFVKSTSARNSRDMPGQSSSCSMSLSLLTISPVESPNVSSNGGEGRASGNQDTVVEYEEGDEELIESIAKEYREQVLAYQTP